MKNRNLKTFKAKITFVKLKNEQLKTIVGGKRGSLMPVFKTAIGDPCIEG